MSGRAIPSAERPDTAAGFRHQLSRYDLLLAVVPAAFVLGLVAVGLAGVPLRVAMASAAAVGALELVDGLFRDTPRRPGADGGVP